LSESGPLPDVPAEAPEATAEQLLVLDRALVQAAYRMQSETYQFQLDETEKRITQLKEEVEKLWTEVDQYRERIEECDRLIAEIEQAETVALR
jgi:septal ring factor EnvC (AmiA/AmiB activator)